MLQLLKRNKLKHDTCTTDLSVPCVAAPQELPPVSAPTIPPQPVQWDTPAPAAVGTPVPSPKENPLKEVDFFAPASFEEAVACLVAKDALYRPAPGYLGQHPEMRARMRAVLMDWLIEVCVLLTSFSL